MKYKAITIFTMFLQCVFAQETFKTSTKASEVVTLFSQKSTVEWAVPISKNKNLLLQWSERKTSFSEKEGIRTFVGYQDDLFVATLSISKGNLVSGNIQKENGEIHLQTTKDGFISFTKQEVNGTCGTCADGSCNTYDTHSHHHSTKHTSKTLRRKKDLSTSTNIETTTSNYEIITDGIYREYRLAAFVDYNYFSGHYNSDIKQVKAFWSRLETSLNEFYQRDLGIKFTIVDDERLIAKDKQVFNGNPTSISNSGTRHINNLINSNSYDVGIIITDIKSQTYGAYGLTDMRGAYLKKNKGNSTALNNMSTIGHELGHLFGSIHTFYYSHYTQDRSLQTEPNSGTSIMGIGTSRHNFFSLPSVQMIREAMFANGGYYEDRARTKLKDRLDGGNHTYGKPTGNKAPVINRSKLKRLYKLPLNTYFQFNISAKDPDGHQLLYAAHQADIKQGHKAKFEARKSSTDSIVTYQIRNLFKNTYTFWLGVNDGNDNDKEHATQYDMYETKVEFVEGTTFQVKDFNNRDYKVGEKMTLTWAIDRSIFNNTKIRILLTDINGKTKQILVPSADNDGSEEIIIPNQVSSGNRIKIEVLDHIAYDITDSNFSIKSSNITFQNLP